MEELWINYGLYLIMVQGFIFIVIFVTTFYYTGSVKKLDLIAKDIREKGAPYAKTLTFDKFWNSMDLDPLRLSTITHLFYIIPNARREPKLYEDEYFIEQLRQVRVYKVFYKWAFTLFAFNLSLILIFTLFYGENIK